MQASAPLRQSDWHAQGEHTLYESYLINVDNKGNFEPPYLVGFIIIHHHNTAPRMFDPNSGFLQ